jgi:hypothetical protein
LDELWGVCVLCDLAIFTEEALKCPALPGKHPQIGDSDMWDKKNGAAYRTRT